LPFRLEPVFQIVAVLTAGGLEQPVRTLLDFRDCLRVSLVFRA
jgi:hypothetical protein